ncbi:hypothetical protein Tco_0412628 [Tanacetum coccineum]
MRLTNNKENVVEFPAPEAMAFVGFNSFDHLAADDEKYIRVIKEEFEKLGLFEINEDLFTYDTQLGMIFNEFNRLSRINDDLFTYEIKVPKPTPSVILINKRLVRIFDVTVEQWLYLKYRNHKKMDKNIKKGVIGTWLIRSYKRQFEEYLEIKRQRETYAREVDMEYNLSNLVFAEWLASKFYNHLEMDWYTKNALWVYWMRGDDEVVISNEEVSDLNNKNNHEEHEIVEIFRIETNLFDFETPTCKALKEFKYLFQIDLDVLTKDIVRFKTYKEYKEDWIYEWKEDVPWVHEKPWMDDGVWEELAPVKHYCEPFLFKSGHSEWPTCSWKDDGYCNGGNLPEAYRVGNTLCYQDLEWYEALMDGKLKDKALKNKAIVEGMIDEDKELCELFDDTAQEPSICKIRRFEMIKYSFGQKEEYVAIKEYEYDDSTRTNEDVCHAYQEIFRNMDEGWLVTRAE